LSALGNSAKYAKYAKYANVDQSHGQPLAFENVGSMKEFFYVLIINIGHKMSSVSGDDLEGKFLFQWPSVTIQRFNAILLNDNLSYDELN